MARHNRGMLLALLAGALVGCPGVTDAFPLDGTNGTQGDYGGVLTLKSTGRHSVFQGALTTQTQYNDVDESDLVLIIKRSDEGGALVLGLDCDLPLTATGMNELSLTANITCTRTTKSEDTAGGVVTQHTTGVQRTFKEVTITKSTKARNIKLKASGDDVTTLSVNGSKNEEISGTFEMEYDGVRQATE